MDLSYRYIPMDRFQRGSDKVSEVLVPEIDFKDGKIKPNDHREKRTINELAQLDVSYGITERFTLTFAIPFLNNRLHEHFVEVGTLEEEFTRQDSTNGLGDLRLIGKYALWISTKHLLVGGWGVKIPTGEHKLLNSHGKINEPTLMPGTGSWDGLFSAYYSYQVLLHKLDTFLSGSYQVTSENDLDYQFGNTFLLNGGVSYLFAELNGGKTLTTSLQVNARIVPHDEFKGQEVPSTGGRWVYVTPGVKVQASSSTAIYAHIQVPIYQFVNEVNLVPRYGLIFGVSHAF